MVKLHEFYVLWTNKLHNTCVLYNKSTSSPTKCSLDLI